jgi:hypothetical protein
MAAQHRLWLFAVVAQQSMRAIQTAAPDGHGHLLKTDQHGSPAPTRRTLAAATWALMNVRRINVHDNRGVRSAHLSNVFFWATN